MAEKTIKNPSLLPGDLEIELSGNAITAISGHPLIGTGGGTQSDYVYYPDFDETTGNIEFKLGTIDDPPSPIGGWHISGADGATGPQGDPGEDGKTPTFQINSKNAHWEWKYIDDVDWTDTYVVASGTVGPKGDDGDDGDDGISPTVSTETIAGGNRVTFTYDTPSKTKYIDVMSGAPGAPGAEGFSPTISTTPITDAGHPQGGTKVTVTNSTGSEEFNIWNGLNGEGATVNLLEGTGIQITEDGTNYTIGVSADYALKSELPDVTDMATKTWVGQQGYLSAVPNTYALKTDVEAASANALSEAESWVENKHYLTAVPDSYATKTYANEASANALGQAQSWVETEGYLKAVPAEYATKTYANEASANAYNKAVAEIPSVADFITKDVDDLTYYYKKTETSSTSELSTEFANKVNKPDTSLTDKYLVLRTDTNGAVSGWCDYNDKIYSKSESDLRYMQKNTDSTLSGNGTTNSPLGIDTTDAYTIDGTNGITAVPDATSNKVIVQLTNDIYQDVQHVHTSATVWDTVSAKSNTNITSAGMVTVTNTSGTTVNGVVQYAPTSNRAIPRMLLCANEDSWTEIVENVLPAASGMGCLIFVLEPH